ncbi:MAG: hypothetical protein DRR08_33025 [Candidatus Parabeggiatoa sp. nov. 2]|nr:MAG: hypothetical protein B6247_02020 [Beggiatoa sp. 4572_84]RKZ46756.1 MAG: hypothetical protein DRR08_33025 [Gammaproteobacteria bacterium]
MGINEYRYPQNKNQPTCSHLMRKAHSFIRVIIVFQINVLVRKSLQGLANLGACPNAIKLRALHVGLPLRTGLSARGNPLWLPSRKSLT